MRSILSSALLITGCFLTWTPATAQPSRAEVTTALHRAVDFFRKQVSAEGGYVYQVSADLSKFEGEGKVGASTAWIQPPGTPSVGLAYLRAYQMCGDPVLLEAARETAGALVRGQLRSGGWDNRIEFDPDERRKYAYRVDPDDGKKRRNTTTFDDNKSQSAISFLMRLDKELQFQDDTIHQAARFALDAAVRAQYPNGAWPQRYSEFPDPSESPVRRASIPKEWSRTFPAEKYSAFYTLNDNTMSDLIEMMLDAWEIYQDERFRESAERGGEFFLLAQLPEPQPGWAQQYDRAMHPAWARKFEPPAVTGGESQGVMRALLMLYRRTGAVSDDARRFLEPLPRALEYYRRSQLDDGRLARFYELGSNRPLFFTKDYQLTYSSDDMPTHYAFIVSSKLDRIESEWEKVAGTPRQQLWRPEVVKPPSPSKRLDERVLRIMSDLDSRGAWVESGRLRYHGDDDPTREVIHSRTFVENVGDLAGWLGANRPPGTKR